MPAAIMVLLTVILTIAVVHVESGVVRQDQQTLVTRQFAGQFRAYSLAALAFAEGNPGYSGSINDAQIAPYLSPWTAFTVAHGAGIQGGVLDVWATPPGLVTPQESWIAREMTVTDGDVAYSVNASGTLLSPVGGNEGPAPVGVPNGAAVYQIQAPN